MCWVTMPKSSAIYFNDIKYLLHLSVSFYPLPPPKKKEFNFQVTLVPMQRVYFYITENQNSVTNFAIFLQKFTMKKLLYLGNKSEKE